MEQGTWETSKCCRANVSLSVEDKHVCASYDTLYWSDPYVPSHNSLSELLWVGGEIMSSLAWEGFGSLWNTERTGGCIFFSLLSVLFQKKKY